MLSLTCSNNGKETHRSTRAVELQPVNVEQTESLLRDSEKQGRPFQPGNTAAKGRKPLIARGALSMGQTEGADPRLRVYLKRGEQYRRVRMQELTRAHGYVSCGVGAMIATEARLHALSQYFMEIGSVEGTPELLLKSATFAKDARSQSLSAWELCAREAVTRSKEGAKPMAQFLSSENT